MKSIEATSGGADSCSMGDNSVVTVVDVRVAVQKAVVIADVVLATVLKAVDVERTVAVA